MNITKTTSSYNDRRYSKPWIARVDFSKTAQGDFIFGNWIGDAGAPGELSINCQPGDVIATGQKDFRKPKNSAPDWFVANSDGTLEPCTTKVAARNLSRERQSMQKTPLEAAQTMLTSFGL